MSAAVMGRAPESQMACCAWLGRRHFRFASAVRHSGDRAEYRSLTFWQELVSLQVNCGHVLGKLTGRLNAHDPAQAAHAHVLRERDFARHGESKLDRVGRRQRDIGAKEDALGAEVLGKSTGLPIAVYQTHADREVIRKALCRATLQLTRTLITHAHRFPSRTGQPLYWIAVRMLCDRFTNFSTVARSPARRKSPLSDGDVEIGATCIASRQGLDSSIRD